MWVFKKIGFGIMVIGSILCLNACVQPNLNMPMSQLSQSLNTSAVRVQQESGQLKITLLTDNAFQTKASHLTPSIKQVLAKISRVLHDHPELKVVVNVYTDNRNQPKTSHLISLRHAMVIADYFRNHGVSSNRISINGMGDKDPIASNATSQGRAQNRRVEIILS